MSKEKLQQQFLYLFSIKRTLQVILFAATIIISQFSNAQNPGGVAGARLWLKANAGSNATEGTAPSTFWADQTANGRNATPFSSHGPLLRSTAINFNPAFRFTPTATGNSTDNTGSDAITIPEGTLNFSSSYLYLVGKRSDISQTYANRTGSYDIGASANYFNRAFSENNPGISSYDLYHIWRENGETANRSGTGASAGSVNKYVIINGQSPAALTDGLDIGRGDPTFHNLNGDIAEIIVCPTPTTANHLKILSYLALKYGITLDQTLPQNYVASDGSLAWDASISGIFKNNIFGIGKDAASALDQRVANSVNAGQFVAISTSNDFVSSNPGTRASLADKNFLMLADDGGDISAWTSTGAPANKLIIGRQWQFQSAGTVGNIYVQVDRNALPGFYNPTDIFLLYDNTGSGDYSTIIPTVSVSQTGGKYVFKLPAFIDGGARFTIASNKPACGITAAFTGTDSTVFAGSTLAIAANQLGNWISANPANATVAVGSPSSNATISGIIGSTTSLLSFIPADPLCSTITRTIIIKDILIPPCTTPAIPAGPNSVIVGAADITLTADQAGTWSITSGNSFATLNSATSTTLNVHGVSPGTATITFTPDCGGEAQAVTRDINVSIICINPTVPAGPGAVTVGAADITLTADQSGTWTITSGSSFATLNTATSTTVKVHGIAPGTATITFTPDCGGAAQAVTKDIVVNCTAPAIPAGPGSVTVGGADVTLTADQAGSWAITSGNSHAVLINATSTTVNVHGITPGTATITFTPDCGGLLQAVIRDVLVNCIAPGIPAGAGSITVGGTDATLTADQPGVWSISSGNSFVTLNGATSTTVNVHGVAPGAAIITFTPDCGGSAQAVNKNIVVNCTAPATPAGPGSVIAGSADITLTADQAGSWTITSGNSFVTLNGVTSTSVNVHAVAAGTATITFIPDCGGAAQAVTKNIDVSISCVTPGIPTGPSSMTIGDADITLTADQAGVWSIIAGNSFATLDAVTPTTVNVHALSAGSVTVSFTPSCGGVAQAVTNSIHVNPAGVVCALAPEFVTAPAAVFVGASVPISANQPGLWSSGTAYASITPVVAASNAIITGVSAGSTVISFSPSDAACPTIAKIVTVNLASTGPIRLVVFPNPVTDQLSIRADMDELKSVKIFGSNGQDLTPMVRKISEVNNTVVLDVSKLPPGTYNIKTATSNTKIIKQ